MGWTPDQLPELKGRTFVITGGNSGLGLEATKILCGKGARVVFTSRSEDKAKAAIERIVEVVPDADVDFVQLDLSSKEGLQAGAAAIREKCPTIDALINNAGVMQTPEVRTDEGWELQLATNHLGHFRLNALLFDVLEASKGRIVPVSSIAHKFGAIGLDDLMFTERRYDPTVAYGQSKLANIMYGFELQRRLEQRGSSVIAIPTHPGYAATNLQSAGVGLEGGSWFFRWLYAVTNVVVAQAAEKGAWPLVLAAADPDAKPGAYYGPTGMGQMRGAVGESFIHDKAKDEDVARQLWEKTEELVGPFFG